MRRRAKRAKVPAKAKAEGNRTDAARLRNLEVRLAEALEQQAATAAGLKVISRSTFALQPVLDALVENAVRLCGASTGIIFRLDGEVFRWWADHGSSPALRDFQEQNPIPVGRGSVIGRAALERCTVHSFDVLADPEFDRAEHQRVGGFRTLLGVPMLREGVLLGVFSLQRQAVQPFTDKQIELVTTFADQAVIAIENVRLFTELQEKNRALTEAHAQVTEALAQQRATADILRVISSSPIDVQPVFSAIVESAARLTGAVVATVYEFDGSLVHLRVIEPSDYPHGDYFRRNFPRPPAPDFAAGRVILDRALLHRADLQNDPDTPELTRDWARQMDLRSVLWVPMLREGEPIGVIGAVRREAGLFADDEVRLLQTFADQAVIAIENVRLFNETREALERQVATGEVLRVISQSPTDAQPVFDMIARSTARLCGAFDVLVLRVDGDILRVVAHYGPLPAGDIPIHRGTVGGRTVLDRQPIHLADVQAKVDEFPEGSALARERGMRTNFSVPLLREGVAIGNIQARRDEVRPFTDQQMSLLKTFADQAVIAIENVRLFKELQVRNADLSEALDRQTATAEILRVISQSQTEVQPVFDAIVDNAIRLFRGWAVAVMRSDGQLLHLVAARGGVPGTEEYLRRRSPWPIQGLLPVSRCVAQRALIHISDAESDPALDQGLRDLARTRGWRSVLAAPLLRDGQPIGAITVTRAEAGPFSSAEVELLQAFADQAVIAVENARLLSELQMRTTALTDSVDQLTALGEDGRAASSTLDLETVLTTIVSRAVELSDLDGGVVFEYDEGAGEFVHRVATETGGALAEARRATRVRKGEGVVGQTAITLEPAQVPDITMPGAYESRLRENLITSGVRAVLAVPMLSEDRLVGCLVVSRNLPGEFPAETIELLRTFATQSALAIQNARLYQEIADKSHQLEAASRHKSEFLANMSHELRTPLNAVIGFSEVLLQRMFGELSAKQDEYLKDIYASGQHLLSLINDILDLSKIEAGRMELAPAPFHLPSALENAVTLVRERAARHGIALQVDVDPRLGELVGDERKVKQVLLNLLSNAVKFTPEGGRISLKAARRDEVVEIVVADTGIGIAPEDQAAIFEEFRQVGSETRKQEGTGLGLTLAKKFVELHGGRIWVESEVSRGSTFCSANMTVPGARRDLLTQ